MGLIGMLKNAGKVAGPIMAGFLISWIDFEYTLNVIGAMLLLGAIVLLYYDFLHRKKRQKLSRGSNDRL